MVARTSVYRCNLNRAELARGLQVTQVDRQMAAMGNVILSRVQYTRRWHVADAGVYEPIRAQLSRLRHRVKGAVEYES